MYQYAYDHALRPTTTTYTLNDAPSVVLASNTYDELGRLVEKHRHGAADVEQFEYNIRNWITKINSGTGFEQNLYYNNPVSSYGVTPKSCFNGNISLSTWKYNGATNGYMYYYDGLNRLSSTYSILNNQWADGYLSESFSYDKHGNIKSLSRWDNQEITDYLNLSYTGNQLKKVTDNGISQNSYTIKEYNDFSNQPTEFIYDKNGNMTTDLDREIVTVRYNSLNLPDTVQFMNGNQIINRYSADGRKLQTEYVTAQVPLVMPIGNVANSTGSGFVRYGTVYAGHIEYRFGNMGYLNLSRIHNPEGYVEYNTPDDGFEGDIQELNHYSYYRRDHLGNVREVWSPSYYIEKDYGAFQTFPARTSQRTQYYPSGLPWAAGEGKNEQPYKFGGKEFVETHGYDTYDFGARGMYPAIMRFSSIDPLAEKYYSVSPYAYCLNNPVRFIDPTGKDPEDRAEAHNRIQADLIQWFKNLFTVHIDPQNPQESKKEHEKKIETLGQINEGIKTLTDILLLFNPFGSLIEVAARATAEDNDGALAAVPFLALDVVTLGEGSKLTQWGWKGSKIWKSLVKEVKVGGTIEHLLGKTPTKEEAKMLLKEAGVNMSTVRTDPAHLSPNPHSYPHINYTTPNGSKGTIKIQ
ncbi:hypothetical protein FACS1894182_08430 [Bacteroidia bacterium]|nr:hypothetical protein FACS1894182_08430 [Bacteroidia bacterium]